MEVLIVGWSDIVRKRVIPALTSVARVSRVHIAGREVDRDTARSYGIDQVHTGPSALEDALGSIQAGLAYISGTNADHADRALTVVAAGVPALIDKPALEVARADEVFAAAAAAGVLIDEALVWADHPQVTGLLDRLAALGRGADLVEVTFAIPGPPTDDFRWDPAVGGGVVSDMGVYLMSAARLLLAGAPVIERGILTPSSDGRLPDAALAAVLRSTGGGIATGLLAFGRAYLNRITVLAPGVSARLEPAFSGPTDHPRFVRLEVDGRDRSFEVAAADPFRIRIERVLDAIEAGVVGPTPGLVASVQDLGMLRHAAKDSMTEDER